MSAAASFVCMKDNINDNHKLTKVTSTKLSIEYYNALQTITNLVYENGGIDEPTVSEFLRFIIVHLVNEMRKQQGFLDLEHQLVIHD